MSSLATSSARTNNNPSIEVLSTFIGGFVIGIVGAAVTARKITKHEPSAAVECESDSVAISLPDWAHSRSFFERKYESDEDMMSLAVELSAKNVEKGTGGPFGCAIFERDMETQETKLFSIGVNRVVPLGNCTLHGETVACQFAQKKLGSFSLQPKGGKQYEMFTSCEPCCMCLGATLWSGVSRLVCAATKDDASSIGFDEGPVTESSYEHLRKAGIDVKKEVLRNEAAAVLEHYGKIGKIYNGTSD